MVTTTAHLRDGGVGSRAYSEAVGVYLAFAVDKVGPTTGQLSVGGTDT